MWFCVCFDVAVFVRACLPMCMDLCVCASLCVFVCALVWVEAFDRVPVCVANDMFQFLVHCLYLFLSEFINLYPSIFLYILRISGLIDVAYRWQEQLILDLFS